MAIEISGHPAIGYGIVIDGVDEQMLRDLVYAKSLHYPDVIKLIVERGLIELHNEYLKKES